MPTKRTSKKPRPTGGNKVPKIHPPKPAPMRNNQDGHAGRVEWPMPKRWR